MGEIRTYQHEPAVTDMQERFAIALAAGMTQTEAARVAGYADPRVAGVRLSRSVAVRAVVKAARVNRLDKLASLSLRELEAMIKDRTVSAAVRFNAIKLSLALAGHVENAPPEDVNPLNKKDISSMSLAELDAFIKTERGKRADAAKPVLDHIAEQPNVKPLITLDNVTNVEPSQGCEVLVDDASELDGEGRSPPGGGHPPERLP